MMCQENNATHGFERLPLKLSIYLCGIGPMLWMLFILSSKVKQYQYYHLLTLIAQFPAPGLVLLPIEVKMINPPLTWKNPPLSLKWETKNLSRSTSTSQSPRSPTNRFTWLDAAWLKEDIDHSGKIFSLQSILGESDFSDLLQIWHGNIQNPSHYD